MQRMRQPGDGRRAVAFLTPIPPLRRPAPDLVLFATVTYTNERSTIDPDMKRLTFP
jgi:hypothetical protein